MATNIIIRAIRFLLKGLISFLIIMLLYFAAAVIGSVIPVNTDPEEGNISIYLRTNGMHTDFIFPLRNEVMDWTEVVDPMHSISKREDFNYVSFGWGDLDFYRETQEWSDIRFPVAFQAVFLPSQSALHVEFLQAIRFLQPTVKLEVTEDQYRKLSTYVVDSFERDASEEIEPVADLHYNQSDVFYPAEGSLNFFYTCNSWVNSGLKKAGLRACLWTPFEEGIFHQYR
jgi:uncharacterized protein (TIGR02117 family)